MNPPKWATTVTSFSNALTLIIFFTFLIVFFFLGKMYGLNINNQVPLSSEIQIIPTAEQKPIDFQELLYSLDNERSNPEVCGYTDFELFEEIYFLLKSKVNLANNRIEDLKEYYSLGVWTNNCELYSFYIGYPGKGVYDTSFTGLWLYELKNKTLKLLKKTGLPLRWISNNLLVVGQGIIDINSGKMILDKNNGSTISFYGQSNYYDWVKFRDKRFPWTFMYPKIWEIDKQAMVIEDNKIETLAFIVRPENILVRFTKILPNFDPQEYSTDGGSIISSNLGYQKFDDRTGSLDPWVIYINKSTKGKYIPYITINRIKDQSQATLKVNNYLTGGVFESMEPFE